LAWYQAVRVKDKVFIMKRNPSSKRGFVYARTFLGVLLLASAVSLAMLSFGDPVPPNGTLTPTNLTITYTDGPLVPNPTGVLPPPVCAGANTCSDFTVTINAASLAATHNFTWSVQWPVPNVDMDIFIENPDGSLVANNNSTTDPSAITLPIPPNGTVYHLVVASSVGTSIITGTATLEPKYPTAQQGAGAPPRYMHYRAGAGQGDGANEPSIGIDWNPNVPSLKHEQVNTGGVAFFTVGPRDYRVNFDDCSSPAVNLWEDVSAPFTQQFALSDPIGFVDHFSNAQLGLGANPPQTPGRVFSLDLIGGQGDSLGSYSDSDGNSGSWLPGGNGGAPAGPDHETLGGGPFHSPVGTPPAPAYPNAIYYCSQNGAQNAECSASYDGGATFGPGVPLFDPTVCGGGIHGHVKVSPQGTAYVPNSSCAAGSPLGANGVGRSTDNGISWHEFNVPNSTGSQDPAIGIGQNNVGKPANQVPNTIYLGWISADNHAHIAHSPDEGATWQNDIDVSSIFGIQKAVFPIVVAGDDNRASYAFLGTYPAITNKQVWHLYVATTYDGGKSWVLTDTTPDDPVQIGDVCLLGLSCTSANRNLLDFNGIDVDKEGRVLIAYTDGCPNCSNTQNISQSSAAKAVVARQAGGPRLFAAFDSQPQAGGIWPPAAPQVLSAVRQSAPTGVAVTWLKPDNGGSTIIGYNVYRHSATQAETLLKTNIGDVMTVSGENTNKFLDQSADSSTNYFYRVAAVNAVAEGASCREVSINGTGGAGTACLPPYVQEGGPGIPGNVSTDPTQGELTIERIAVGEPFSNCSDNSVTLTMKVQTLDPGNTGQPVLPENAEWKFNFVVTTPDNVDHEIFVSMDTFASNNASSANPNFSYGRKDPTPTGTSESMECFEQSAGGTELFHCPNLAEGTGLTAHPSASFTKDGTITIKLNFSVPLSFTAPQAPATGSAFTWNGSAAGTTLKDLRGSTILLAGVLLETVNTTGTFPEATGGHCPTCPDYTRIGNVNGCNTLNPLAILTATPLTGPTSTNFSFDGRGSFEPSGACGVINSYTLDFGDGTTPQTNSTGMFSHTYGAPGNYPARLTVHDSIGHASVNVAQVVIAVTSGQIQLAGAVSRKTHGAAGDKDIVLALSGPPTVECRAPHDSADSTNDYKLIFVFPNELQSVGTISASATGTPQPNTPTGSLGTDHHQYIVNLTGVPNAQYLTVTLNNVHDLAGATGNVSVTMGVLEGDVNGSRVVTSGDTNLCKAQALQPITDSNFRMDTNASGAITTGDVNLIKQHALNQLPTPP
jgi:hypothetical protein